MTKMLVNIDHKYDVVLLYRSIQHEWTLHVHVKLCWTYSLLELFHRDYKLVHNNVRTKFEYWFNRLKNCTNGQAYSNSQLLSNGFSAVNYKDDMVVLVH